MYEIFAELLSKFDVKTSSVAKDTGISPTVFSEWKKGKSTPKADKRKKIADYFGVSLEYLDTGKEKEGGEKYYLNDETAQMAQDIFENKELKMLFDVARNAPAERLKAYYNMISSLEKQEHPDE